MRGKIMKRTVDGLQAPAKGEVVLWDESLAGFGVRVRPGAGGKTYMLMYRAGVGRGAPLRKLTIGTHGSPWTPDGARIEAKRLLGLVAGGADPAAVKTEHRKAETVDDLAGRFLTEHVRAKRKGSTAAEYERLVDLFVRPALGPKKIADVTRADIARLHHAHRDTPYQANRILAVLSKMFSLAEAWGLRRDGSNPCRHIERNPERGRERMLSAAELARLGDALAAYDGSPYITAAVKLLLFSGARLSEILGLRWEWINLERGEARLPDSKTGAKTLHLPPPALAVLNGLPRLEGNPYVVVGQKDGASLVNLQKPWQAIRKAAGLTDVRLHDLRHSYASVGAAGGDSLLVIGKLLGHHHAATTERYAHLALDPIKAAAASIAGRIASALDGATGNGEVVPLARRSAGQ
jgi:integrase